jgi:hypothetical protein
MFRGRSVHIPHMSGCAFWPVPHSVNVQGTLSAHSSHVRLCFLACASFSEYSGNVECTFLTCQAVCFWPVPRSVNIQGTFSECSGDVQ